MIVHASLGALSNVQSQVERDLSRRTSWRVLWRASIACLYCRWHALNDHACSTCKPMQATKRQGVRTRYRAYAPPRVSQPGHAQGQAGDQIRLHLFQPHQADQMFDPLGSSYARKH